MEFGVEPDFGVLEFGVEPDFGGLEFDGEPDCGVLEFEVELSDGVLEYMESGRRTRFCLSNAVLPGPAESPAFKNRLL